MFVPNEFQPHEFDFAYHHIKKNPFGLLVSQGSGQILATHLPFVLKGEGKDFKLFGHISSQNPQCQHTSGECLAVFSGPDAYISPLWYGSHQNVGTWNYTSVHVYGEMMYFDNEQKVIEFFELLYQTFDPEALPHLHSQNKQYLEILFDQLKCFEFKIKRIEAAAKLSQNKSPNDRANIVEKLSGQSSENSRHLADLMRKML